MDVGQDSKVPGVFEGSGYETSFGKVVLHDATVTGESEIQNYETLKRTEKFAYN